MSTVPRRWLAFRLRTLFVVVLVLSLPLAWVGYSLNWIRERQDFLSGNGVMGGRAQDLLGRHCQPPPPWAPCGLWLFGERATQVIFVPPEKADAASRLFPETGIYIKVQDGTGVQPLALFQQLQEGQRESTSSIAPARVP